MTYSYRPVYNYEMVKVFLARSNCTILYNVGYLEICEETTSR
jgi:hypothetical protein